MVVAAEITAQRIQSKLCYQDEDCHRERKRSLIEIAYTVTQGHTDRKECLLLWY